MEAPKFNICIEDNDKVSREVKIKVEISIEGTLTLNSEHDVVSMDFSERKGPDVISMLMKKTNF